MESAISATATFYYEGADLLLQLYVQPNATVDCFVGLHGSLLKVKISTQAVTDRANRKLRQFLAHQFQVAKSQITLEKGAKSRHKLVRITDPKQIPPAVRNLLEGLADPHTK